MAERAVQALVEVTYVGDDKPTRFPVFKSHYLQLERKTGRAMPRGVGDIILLAYRVVHGEWPRDGGGDTAEDVLDAWYDSVELLDMLAADGSALPKSLPGVGDNTDPFVTAQALMSWLDSSPAQV